MQARCGLTFCGGQELQLNSLNACCKVTALRLEYCQLGRTGAVSLAEAIASFLSASLAEVDPEGNKIEVGEGRPLALTPPRAARADMCAVAAG